MTERETPKGRTVFARAMTDIAGWLRGEVELDVRYYDPSTYARIDVRQSDARRETSVGTWLPFPW